MPSPASSPVIEQATTQTRQPQQEHRAPNSGAPAPGAATDPWAEMLKQPAAPTAPAAQKKEQE